MDEKRRTTSKKAIEKKTKTKKKQEESIAKLELDFGNFLKDKSEETGFSETDIVNAMINSQFAVIEFDETVGKASLVFNNWQVPTTVIPENQPISAKIISEFRDLRDNFAPVSAGVEWHLGFTIGGGFEVNIADLTDKHQREMQEEIIKWCKAVHQDEYLISLKSILEIMEDTALTDGCSAAEILYQVETNFEDYIEGYEPIEVPDLKDPKKKRIIQVPIMREPNWNKKLNDEDTSPILGGITRLKIIEDAVNRLRPYRHPKSGRILFWTLDEKIQDPWATREIINQSPIKFHPWEIFWKTGNRRGTNLKARSIIQPVYSLAKFLQSIQNAVGVGFNRWANKKYFFVCGSEKRTWGKKHLDEFLKSMELMIQKNWVGIPVPYGFEIKEIGGEQSIFEGKNLLDHLVGMICAGMNYPREFLEVGRTQAGDKSWLAWTVRYGRNQQYLKDAVEQQLWQRHLWCKFGKEHRISKKGVKVEEQKMEPIFVPLMEWKAEGQWLKSQKMKELKSVLDAANPADPPLKIKVEKEMAKVLGLGEIDFSQIEELLDIQTQSRIIEAKMELMKSETKMDTYQLAKDKGELGKMLEDEEAKAREETVEEELEERQKKRLKGGVSRTARDKETQKGKARDVGGTRQPSLEETVSQIVDEKLLGEKIITEQMKREKMSIILDEQRKTEKTKQKTEETKQQQIMKEMEKIQGEIERNNEKKKTLDNIKEEIRKKKTVKSRDDENE